MTTSTGTELPPGGDGATSRLDRFFEITARGSTVGDEIVYGWRSFEIYPLQTRTAGATPVQVPLTDYTYDLDAMAAFWGRLLGISALRFRSLANALRSRLRGSM